MNVSKYDKEFVAVLSIYGFDINTMTDKQADELLFDINFCKNKYGLIDYSEYFKYDFLNKNQIERNTFCGSAEYGRWCRNSIKNSEDKQLSKNKYLTYLRAKKYYNRDLIKVTSFADYQQFVDFVNKHKTYIVKSIDGSRGMNISKVVVSDSDSIKSLFFQALQYGGCVCEEWIEQSNIMAEFNDSSVNTIRLATFCDDGNFKGIYGMFRTGTNGMPVDNASMGGIACGIDLNAGVVFSDGYTKKNKCYSNHPDSGKKFKGFQLPEWNNAVCLAKELHTVFPEFKIMGWDLSFTDKGWTLVEINSKPSIDTIQLIYDKTYGRGLKEILQKTVGKYE